MHSTPLQVTPRKGSAILWPSVHSHDPWETEDLTYHEAVTVHKGEKYAANFWIHMFEFQKMLLNGCDNEDYFQANLLRGAGAGGLPRSSRSNPRP